MKNIPNTKGIAPSKDGYVIYTGRRYLGYADTLIEALMMRDWCYNNNYKKYPKKPDTCTKEKYIYPKNNGKYIIIKYFNKKLESFGVFDTLNEAIRERDLLIKCNWDYELVCEVDERINNKTIYLGEEVYERRL